MNLRKLLCGLLALSLLLTMVPMAFMEEAYVGDSIVEIGEVADAQNASIPVIEDDDPDPVDPVKDTAVTLYLADTAKKPKTRTLTYEYDVVGADTNTVGTVQLARSGKKLKITALKEGSTVVTVSLRVYLNAAKTQWNDISAIVNVTVKGDAVPKAVNMWDVDGYNITGSTLKNDLSDGSFLVYANVYAGDGTKLKYGEGAYKKLIWSSSKTSVASVAQIKDDDGNIIGRDDYGELVRVTVKKPGTAKITATVKGTAVKCSITVKVSEKHKPTSIDIKTDANSAYRKLTNGKCVFPIGAGPLYLYAEVNPTDYTYEVTWSIDSMNNAYFKDGSKKVKSIKVTNGNVYAPLPLYIKKAGTVKITAKLYNGKKKTLKVELLDLTKANTISIGYTDGIDSNGNVRVVGLVGKKYEVNLTYVDTEWTDYSTSKTVSKQKGGKVYVLGMAKNYLGDEISPSKSLFSWSSSNKSVATIKKYALNGSFAEIELKKKGTTKIKLTITSGTGIKKSETFTLVVKDPKEPKTIYFVDEDNIAIDELTMEVGQKASVNVMAEYLTGSSSEPFFIAYSQLKFSSSDKHHATVSNKGVITAVKKGTAYIKVKAYNGKTAKLKVVVK